MLARRVFIGVLVVSMDQVHVEFMDKLLTPIGSHSILQGYSASHYTFLVYKRPFPSTCEVTVHSVAPLMAYSFEYPEHL